MRKFIKSESFVVKDIKQVQLPNFTPISKESKRPQNQSYSSSYVKLLKDHEQIRRKFNNFF